jgi:hypothetical protein
MRDFYQVGFAAFVAFVFGGSGANAQVGLLPPSSIPGQGPSSIDGAGVDDPDSELREPLLKSAAPSAAARRRSRFNRVTTTRKEGVPGAPQGARAGSASSASRAAASGPYTSQAMREHRAAANSAIPSGSTWRQERPKAAPPPSATRSVTHNYYPGMRPGLHPNADKATVRSRNGRNSAGAVFGMGLGMSAGRASGSASRSGTAAMPGRAPAAAAPPRR